MLARWVAALDFWIQFSARIARRPAPWIVLHHVLSVPLLVRLPRETVAIEGVGVATRIRSRHLHHLLGDVAPADGPADVEVVQVHPWAAPFRRRRGWLTVPSFVRFRASPEAVPPRRMSKGLRANLTSVRRSGFAARIGERADWPRAREMAEAWARVRFEDPWLPPRHTWRRMRRHGRLLVIGDGARDVAMAVVVWSRGGRLAWFPTLGIADGDEALLRAGAVTAAYEAVLEEARRGAAEVLDTGRCWARTDDPIAAYKSRWGYRAAVDALSPVYAMRALTPAGERFLAGRPLWSLNRSGLRLPG